jgi:glyoxylase-like metal-dependent hydrolase (beta-lactamase superfamily II)
MIQIKRFVFNPIEVNTYLLYDETRECVIIDPGCYGADEEKTLSGFIEENRLKPVLLVNTHCHFDHILGNHYASATYGLEIHGHEGGRELWEKASAYTAMFGLKADSLANPGRFITDGDLLKFGNSSLKVLYTPGHAAGSVCLYHDGQKFVITGDVLFRGSIGRTDLPTGDYDTLRESIYSKLFTLDDATVAYPGHGQETTIGAERISNPFL